MKTTPERQPVTRPRKRAYIPERVWQEIVARYQDEGLTAGELARMYGCTEIAVRRRIGVHGCTRMAAAEADWASRAPPAPPDPPAEPRAPAPLFDSQLPVDPACTAEALFERARVAADGGDIGYARQLVGLAREMLRYSEAAQVGAAETAMPPFNPGEPWTPHPAQTPPDGDWRTWLFLGGRGAGKTRAGAEWLHAAALTRPGARLALVGPTLHDVREVMVDGPSGLRNLPGRERPRYEPTRRRLLWGNGSCAYAFSAEDPESLRGPQFSAGWADEFCVWRGAADTLALLRMGLRLGDEPRLVVTTTPKPLPSLRALLAEPGCRTSRAPSSVNASHLSPAFLESLEAVYGGTRLARQELEGVLVEAAEGALWRADELARAHGAPPDRFDRVVVAVDPPASVGGDACGIVVAGRRMDRGYVLADLTVSGLSPGGWAQRVCEAAARWGAERIVAEANQGGDMVRAVLATAAPPCPVRLVHASRAKRARAEPIAALYEQGRVTHCAPLAALEEELMALGTEEAGRESPDRADAFVWALTELMLETRPEPRLRAL